MPSTPREFLKSPMLFGQGSTELCPRFQDGLSSAASQAVAAQVQSDMANTIRVEMLRRRLTQKEVAAAAGISTKTLRRFLEGESWMKIKDIVGISRAVRTNLAVAVSQGRTAEETQHMRFKDGRYDPIHP